MSDRCLEPDDLAAVLDAPANDPRQQHLERCPRCRALVGAWREFVDPTELVDPSALDAADRDLAARIERVLPATPAPRGAAAWARVGRLGALRRPALALAAGLAVCAIVYAARDARTLLDTRVPAGPGRLRGGAPGASDPLWVRGGATSQLTWRMPPGSTEAVVVAYDAAMRELGRVSAGASTSFSLAQQPEFAAAAFAQVLFLADGDTLARSRLVAPR